MRRWNATAAEVAVEMVGIARRPGPLAERARELLEPLRRIVPYDAVQITAFDPAGPRQVPLVREGYTSLRAFFDSPAYVADLERLSLQGAGPPMRLKDVPVPPECLPAWVQYFHPAGFREGMGVGLVTADRRYLGMLQMNHTDPRPASDSVRELLHRLVPVIAAAVDPLRTVTALAATVADAVAGVVLTRGGGTMPLPGLPGHALLDAGSPVLTAAAGALADGPVAAHFLAPWPDAPPGPDAPTGPLAARVTALGCPPEPPAHVRAVVLVSPPPPLCGLTRRELEILGLLVRGWTNARIAAALFITARTVAAHLEHLMRKLGAESRTVAATRALARGLYIPAHLAVRLPGKAPLATDGGS
ncbi:MAG TPA: helix-turn-helix transcriptional regulator [Pilimelia sp.]|nr:helix-turn-helix transcriptional regulator [Pilimelia sp.]